MVKTSAAAMEGFVPDMAVYSMPYLFRDEDHYWKVLLGDVGKEILAATSPHGVHGLCYYDSGSRSFYTMTRPIVRPEDIGVSAHAGDANGKIVGDVLTQSFLGPVTRIGAATIVLGAVCYVVGWRLGWIVSLLTALGLLAAAMWKGARR